MAVDLSRAVSAGFRAFGIAATYTPSGGDPQAITVVPSRADMQSGLLQTGTVAPTTSVDIQVSEVPTVLEGAELQLGAERFEIKKPMRDAERLVWVCPLRKIA